MLTHEYIALKETLAQGCMVERMEFIQTFGAAQLTEFIDRLELFSSDRLAENTWRFLAKILAIRAAEYIAQVDGLAPCADPCNSDCDCVKCEANREVVNCSVCGDLPPMHDDHMCGNCRITETRRRREVMDRELTTPLVGLGEEPANVR